MHFNFTGKYEHTDDFQLSYNSLDKVTKRQDEKEIPNKLDASQASEPSKFLLQPEHIYMNEENMSEMKFGERDNDDLSYIRPKYLGLTKVCKKEEFIPHPEDITKYYRCVRRKSGKFELYEFSCHSGTIWDPKKQMCSYPWNRHGDSKWNEEGNDKYEYRLYYIENVSISLH